MCAAPNRWAIRDAGIATFYDITSGDAKCSLRTLKASGLTNTSSTEYATGGYGNPRIVGFSSNREAQCTLEDAIFDNQLLAILSGNEIEIESKKIPYQEVVTVKTDAATLTKTPAGALTNVFVVNPDGTNGQEVKLKGEGEQKTGEYIISGKNITFFTGDFDDDTKIRVYYDIETDATATTIRVTSDSFGGTFKLVLQCMVREESTSKDYAAIITIPRAKIQDDWELSLSSEGAPATLNVPIEILKDPTSTTNDMWYMTIYDESLIDPVTP